jgi:hypothetical protein
MNKKLLLSIEEYEALPSEIRGQVPYIYSLNNKGQSLYYFGAKHIMDPKHSQFEYLHEQWLNFLDNKPKEEIVVVHEGEVNEKNLMNLDDAIKKHGESGAIVFWAHQENIRNIRPEPTIQDDAKELLKKFSREEIFYFYIIRGIVSWQRKVEPSDFNEYISKNVERYKNIFGWESFDFSFDPTILATHKKLFGKEFDLNDKEFLRKIPIPVGNLSIINEVARTSSQNRNFFILDTIEKLWNEGKNIFIVYGASHAIMQERAIKEIVEG